jgi:hypothetical protein
MHKKFVHRVGDKNVILKIIKKKRGGCDLFRNDVDGWLYIWYSLLFPQSMYLVLVFVPGAKRCSFTGAVLSRLEESGIVNARLLTVFKLFLLFYQAKHKK